MNHVLSMLVNLSLAIRYGPSLRWGPNLMVLVKGLPTYTCNSQFRHVNHSELSDQSDRCWWNHHCNEAILCHMFTFVAYVKSSKFTKFEAFWWIKMSWIPIFSLNITFGRITLMWHDAQVSERCAIDERKKGGVNTWCYTPSPTNFLQQC